MVGLGWPWLATDCDGAGQHTYEKVFGMIAVDECICNDAVYNILHVGLLLPMALMPGHE
jgi:hypothetical protein